MRVFRWGPGAEETQWLAVESVAMNRLVDGFGGLPMAAEWKPLACRLVTQSDSGDALNATDFPSLHFTAQGISASAVGRVGMYLRGYGELLPLQCDQGSYFAFNATNLVDALDLDASDVVLFSDRQRIIRIDNHVFRPDLLVSAGVFKLPQHPRGAVLLTDSAADIVCRGGLGLDLRLVWQDSL